MSVVIAILLFAIFITYGISEQNLTVTLHNIRVFIARLCNRIRELFQARIDKNLSEWEDAPIEHK